MNCPTCQHVNRPNAHFCAHCRAPLLLQDKYRIMRLLGRGGYGAVYYAEQLHLGNAPSAVKELLPDPNATPQQEQQAAAQFQFEANVLARLSDPALPKVTDSFKEGGRYYLVMEYVEGETLEELLTRAGRPLPEAQVLGWATALCDVLTYLHTRQPNPVIHRDIKPSNIKITPDGKLKLIDFGIAKLMAFGMGTAIAARAVSAPYSPTEQYGTGTDARSDIYALGVTLYHLLTNALPPEGPDRMTRPLTPPRQLNPALSTNTEALVLKAIAVMPTDRFQSAAEVKRALTAPLQPTVPAQMPAPYVPPPPPVYAPPLASPRQTTGANWVGALTVIAAVIICGLAAVIVYNITKAPAPTPAPTAAPPTRVPSTLAPPATTLVSPTLVSSGEMVSVPAGEFTMGSNDGSNDEKPVHTVYLDAFWIDKYEVTNAQFQRFVDAKGYKTDAEKEGWAYAYTGSSWEKVNGANWRAPSGPGSNITNKVNHPVVQVSWNDASAYCAGAGKRLPTEAEWEKAARGPSTSAQEVRTYPWGNNWDGTRLNFCDKNCTFGWADKSVDDGYADTAPVGSYARGASPYGALDLAGNVWEWVADWYDEKYYASSPRNNPGGPTSGQWRVLRGGSWFDSQNDVRAAGRVGSTPVDRDNSVGFRCAQ